MYSVMKIIIYNNLLLFLLILSAVTALSRNKHWCLDSEFRVLKELEELGMERVPYESQ